MAPQQWRPRVFGRFRALGTKNALSKDGARKAWLGFVFLVFHLFCKVSSDYRWGSYFIFGQLLCLHLPIHACNKLHFLVPIKILVTLSEHCISHSVRFTNTVIELLKTYRDPQVSEGVDALKQLFLWKNDTIPVLYFRRLILRLATIPPGNSSLDEVLSQT